MADAGSSVAEAARAAEMDTGWGCTFHRHFASNAIHRDGYVEDCDQPGSHRVVYVFDPDYLEEHDAHLVAAAVAEERATTGRRIEAALALHQGMHRCGHDFWTDATTYRGSIAKVGICPTRAALASPGEES